MSISTGSSVEQQQHGQGQWSSGSTGRVSGAAAARAETTGDKGEAAARVCRQGRRSSTGARAWEIDEAALEIEDHVRELLVHRTMEAGSGDADRGSRRRMRRSSKRMHGSTRRMCAGFRRMRGSSRRDVHGLAEDVAGEFGDARWIWENGGILRKEQQVVVATQGMMQATKEATPSRQGSRQSHQASERQAFARRERRLAPMDVLNEIVIVIIEAIEHMSGEVLISKGLANGGQRVCKT
ncbi:hypothetical protein TRIUR3_14387 [Triticum urartu]|uniref:Uncharacterized protein n=1 Tax=Triticum urartu TaxID=4572 RepID=M7YSP2_TRIUA|nr:hypothetical protein TRIUR3_14387 [Triticum urartu]